MEQTVQRKLAQLIALIMVNVSKENVNVNLAGVELTVQLSPVQITAWVMELAFLKETIMSANAEMIILDLTVVSNDVHQTAHSMEFA